MKVVGLTGGVGMGKTAAGEIMAKHGLPVVDTDLLARQVVEPGEPALLEIQSSFGSAVVDAAGALRRDELARFVFADEEARKKLESILHPRIRELWLGQVRKWRAEGRPVAVVVIPLLFETEAERELDATICVACSAVTQRQRLLARGWPEDQIKQRVQAQWPIHKKITKADYLVWTEAGLDILAAQLDRIFSCISQGLW
jgi:dephospho-CoA kinase